MITNPLLLFDFDYTSNTEEWQIVNDVVMGGRSNGEFLINSEGNGLFKGSVSLDNNGGFSLVRHRFKTKNIKGYKKLFIRLKGDGKRYQFRVKSSVNDNYSYIAYIDTTGDWQTVEIILASMYPTFRGRKLRISNYSGEILEEIAFLIGNKVPENFKLEIDKIALKQN